MPKQAFILQKMGGALLPHSFSPQILEQFADGDLVVVPKLTTLKERSLKQLKLIHAVLKLVYDSQNKETSFKELDDLKTALKIMVGFYDECQRLIDLNNYIDEIKAQLSSVGVELPANFKFKRFIGKDFKVKSFAFAASTQKEMNDVFNEIIAFILTHIAPTRPIEFEQKLNDMLESEQLKSQVYEYMVDNKKK